MPAKKNLARSGTTKTRIKKGAADIHVGFRIRHARMSRRLKMRELAEKVGCSESLLSKVENGHALPSFGTLHKILAVLGLTMGQLFAKSGAPPGIVSRAGERSVLAVHPLRKGANIQLEQLIPYDPSHLLEGSIHIIAPRAGGAGTITHAGEEIFYVINGTLTLTVGEETHTLNSGDSAYFRSELPHGYKNPGPEICRILVVNTPASY